MGEEEKRKRRGQRRSDAKTRLARARQERRVTQSELARMTGISLWLIQRLERGEIPHPPLAYLTNCAVVLGKSLEEVTEPEWGLEWTVFDDRYPRPPA